VQLVSLKELQKIRREHFNQNKKNIEATFYLNERKAILKVHSFSSRPLQNDVKKIRKFFQAARELGIEEIAIDVRDNPGGSSAMVEYLCSFLMPNGLNTPSNIIWKASEYSYQIISNFRLKHFPKFTDKRFKRNEDMYQYFLLSQTPLEKLDTAFFSIPQRQRREHVYNGTLAILMNGNTVSAACDFAQLLQSHQRAVLIGTPCNATANGTWGNATTVQLYESGISYSVPTIRYNYNNTFSYSRTPILPNIPLEQSLEDLKSGKDTVLEYFLEN
jgi:C-terminal processing protease CtpA/Prc